MNNSAHAYESARKPGRKQSALAPSSSEPTLQGTIGSLSAKNGASVRGIRRVLRLSDLRNLGAQKLLLQELAHAEAQCEALQTFVERYHQADKRAAVLEERLKRKTVLDIFFAVGISVGFLILGLIPTFWDGTAKGPAALAAGVVLVIGSIVGRIVRS